MCTGKKQLLAAALKRYLHSLSKELLQALLNKDVVEALSVEQLNVDSVQDEQGNTIREDFYEDGKIGTFSGSGRITITIENGAKEEVYVDFKGNFNIIGYVKKDFEVQATSLNFERR